MLYMVYAGDNIRQLLETRKQRAVKNFAVAVILFAAPALQPILATAH